MLAIEGVEADDIIGTLACRAAEQGVDTIVSTGDKDLAQLVNSQVTLVNTMSGEVLNEAGVLNKFGVPPDRIVDYLMLVGDTVDNVPGVTKVGPKTAAKWISEYGSIDQLIADADGVKGVAGNNLREAIPNFPLTRQLLTVKCDCDLTGHVESIEDLAPRERDDATPGRTVRALRFPHLAARPDRRRRARAGGRRARGRRAARGAGGTGLPHHRRLGRLRRLDGQGRRGAAGGAGHRNHVAG